MSDADLLTVGIFAVALTVLAVVGLALRGAGGKRKARLDKLARRWAAGGHDAGGEATATLRLGGEDSRAEALFLRLMPRRHQLRHRLAKAGLSVSPGRYALICFALAALVALIADLAFKLPLALALAGGVTFGLGLPHMIVGRMTERRIKRFVQLFPEAIDLMVRGIRSGLPVSETIASIGQELADPVGTEFRRIADAVKLGRSMDEAMWDTATRLDTPEFKFFVISLSVQRETGGNLAETLENLSDVLRRRAQMQLKIKAMSSEAKASAYIIGSLPFIMFGILMLMNPNYVMKLFIDPRGMIVVGIGLATMLMGVLVMAKMVKFEI